MITQGTTIKASTLLQALASLIEAEGDLEVFISLDKENAVAVGGVSCFKPHDENSPSFYTVVPLPVMQSVVISEQTR